MRAHARLAVAADRGARGGTRIAGLRSDPPLVLRPTRPDVDPLAGACGLGGAACVSLAAAAAGPVGGDELALDVEVGAGATLILRTVAATLVLPGPHRRPSRTTITLRVAPEATLVWLPQPVIAAAGCDHGAATRVECCDGSRLLAREEIILGRYGEAPGAIRQRLRVSRDRAPVYDQELTVGPDVPGWDGAAVTGGRRALGSVLASGPGLHPAPACDVPGSEVATMALDDATTLVTALAADAHTLRRALDRSSPLAATRSLPRPG
jgi:urease accessory protein